MLALHVSMTPRIKALPLLQRTGPPNTGLPPKTPRKPRGQKSGSAELPIPSCISCKFLFNFQAQNSSVWGSSTSIDAFLVPIERNTEIEE